MNQITRHKLFISYYNEDQQYRDQFEELFGHLFINKSVKPGDIGTDLSTEYIKRLIQRDYITDTSVVVVLVGPKTYCRKYVDWEIYAGLTKKVGGYSGLIGICLPNHQDYNETSYTENFVPPRLVDNVKSKYSKFFDWTENPSTIKKYVEEAFEARISSNGLINNSRKQYRNNICD